MLTTRCLALSLVDRAHHLSWTLAAGSRSLLLPLGEWDSQKSGSRTNGVARMWAQWKTEALHSPSLLHACQKPEQRDQDVIPFPRPRFHSWMWWGAVAPVVDSPSKGLVNVTKLSYRLRGGVLFCSIDRADQPKSIYIRLTVYQFLSRNFAKFSPSRNLLRIFMTLYNQEKFSLP